MINVGLTERQALVFRLMLEARVFDIKSGSAEIFFDRDGNPMKVKTIVFQDLSTVDFDSSLQIVV